MSAVLLGQTTLWTSEDLNVFVAAAQQGLEASRGNRYQGKTQDYSAFLAYILKSTWDVLKSCPDDYSVAIHLTKFLGKLGLRFASEKTILYITGFVVCVSKADHSGDSPSDLYGMYLAMKKLVKNVIASLDEPVPAWIQFLPARPQDMTLLWFRQALNHEAPMDPCPLDTAVLVHQCSRIPARKTHRDLQQHKISNQSPAGQSPNMQLTAMDSVAAMSSLVKEALHIVKGRVGEDVGARIQLLASPPKRRGALLTSNASQPLNFLQAFAGAESREESAPAPAQNLAALEDEMPAETDRSNVFEQAEALNAAMIAAKDLPSRKRPAAAVTAEPEEITKAPMTKDKQIPKSTEKPAAKALPKKQAPKSQASVPSLKRPSASKTYKKADGKADNAYPDLKDAKGKVVVRGAYRRQHWPRGCAKCRERPGCCLSCYRYRGDI